MKVEYRINIRTTSKTTSDKRRKNDSQYNPERQYDPPVDLLPQSKNLGGYKLFKGKDKEQEFWS